VKYLPQWNPDYFDMRPIAKLISDAQAEADRSERAYSHKAHKNRKA
jgi:hypothetical protein